MSATYYIANANIVNEGKIFFGDLVIKNGIIDKIYQKDKGSSELFNYEDLPCIDVKENMLMPGVIDDQVHFREPGLTHKGDIYSESKAAVAGGVTSYMDMPNTVPQAVSRKILDEKFKLASEKSLANYSFYIGATNDNLKELCSVDDHHICGIKVFLGSSTGNMLVNDPEVLNEIFSKTHSLIAIHAEDDEIIQQNLAKYTEQYVDKIPIELHPVIRNTEACYKSSSFAVELAKKHNTRLHILHISTAKELSLLDNTKDLLNKRITAEVCIHHLWFNENDYKRLGKLIKWNPSIKSEEDQLALLQGVLNNKIDIIATDHAPHTLEEKQNSYLKSPSGGPLIQHSLVAMLEFYHQQKISLEKIVEKMCHAPALCFQIEKRGFIREGYHADLAVVNLKSPWKIEHSTILSKCGWSPFEGDTFQSKVTYTFVNGHLAYDNGNFDESQKGQPLTFNR